MPKIDVESLAEPIVSLAHAAVASASDALRLLRDKAASGEPFDLAILDRKMTGLTLARRMKSDPPLADLKLVMLSSHNQMLPESDGFAGWLFKPYRASQLFNRQRHSARILDVESWMFDVGCCDVVC